MSDSHFCYIHMTDGELRMLDDVEDAELLKMPMPEEDIEVPPGLVPPLQEEEDDSILPMTSHPSYPYGNPYTISLLPLRPSARSTKQGLKGNPHTRHIHTWTDLALEDLLPWEGEEPDLNYFAGLEAEAAAAAHAAAAAAGGTTAGEGDGEAADQTGQDFAEMAEEGEQAANSEEGDDTTDASDA